MYVTLEQAKRHLRIEDDYTDDDVYILSLIDVVEELFARDLCCSVADLKKCKGTRGIDDEDDEEGQELPRPLYHAILLTIGTYYTHREDTTELNMKLLPRSTAFIIELYRDLRKL